MRGGNEGSPGTASAQQGWLKEKTSQKQPQIGQGKRQRKYEKPGMGKKDLKKDIH